MRLLIMIFLKVFGKIRRTLTPKNKRLQKLVYRTYPLLGDAQDNCLSDELSLLANMWSTDKGTAVPDSTNHFGPRLFFTPIYELFFSKMKGRSLCILEIGIGGGQSLPMWRQYFPEAEIHAIDIERYADPEIQGVKLHQIDQTDRLQLKSLGEEFGPFDIIIDDGGHMMEQQQVSLGTLFSFLQPGGLYFIEDLHTSFWPYNSYTDLYGTALDINEDRTNTTYLFLMEFMKSGVSNSLFLSQEENQILGVMADKVVVFDLPKTDYGPNRLGMLRRAQGR